MAISQTFSLKILMFIVEFPTAQGLLKRLSLHWSGVIVQWINLPELKSGLAVVRKGLKKIDAAIPFILDYRSWRHQVYGRWAPFFDGAYGFYWKNRF